MQARRKLPVHQQIARALRQRISVGHYGNGEVPPELNLMEEFNVSRHTIRSALQHLVNDGLIERRAGRGTTISKRATGGSWLIGSLDELLGEFPTERMRTLKAEIVPARIAPPVATMFGIPRSGKIFHLTRLLIAKDRPFALADMYTSTANAARVPHDLLDKRLFIELIEKHCALRAARVRQVVSAGITDKRQARALGRRVGDPILLLKRTYRTSDGDAILHVELACHPEIYQHAVEFVHEGHGRSDDVGGSENPVEVGRRVAKT